MRHSKSWDEHFWGEHFWDKGTNEQSNEQTDGQTKSHKEVGSPLKNQGLLSSFEASKPRPTTFLFVQVVQCLESTLLAVLSVILTKKVAIEPSTAQQKLRLGLSLAIMLCPSRHHHICPVSSNIIKQSIFQGVNCNYYL